MSLTRSIRKSAPVLLALVSVVAVLAAGSGSASGTSTPAFGPLRVELMRDIPTDPALAYVTYAWELERATCATLVTYPDAPPPEGTRLQPEIAAAMPTISADGRTYTFRIRDDFAFSPPATGVVTAQSMKYTFERAFDPALASPAAQFFTNIVGARKYNDGQASKISGIVAAGNMLTIKLLEPQGEFLALLAMPFLCAVPTTLPPVEQTGPIPSAGPYYISQRTVGQSIVLSRNPNYTGQRPRRFDSIEYTIGRDEAEIFNRVMAGEADYGYDVPSSVRDSVASQYGPSSPAAGRGLQRYFLDSMSCVGYVPLNTARPLFADVNMRKAVNFAIDRADLVATAGPLTGSPTDQYLPPGVPGYADIQAYPNTPDAWDIQHARDLAGWQPGDPMRPAVLYYRSSGTVYPLLAQQFAEQLHQIGIEPTLVGFPGGTIYTAMGIRGAPFDLAIGVSWCADYNDPWDYLLTLDGTGIQETNNVNYSYFNDPVFNERMHAAGRLVDDERYEAFEQIEHDLVLDAAPYAAWRLYNNGSLFSKRIGCQLYQFPYSGIDLAALCLRPEITVGDVRESEPVSGTATATFTVQLSSEMDDPVTVDFATADGSANAGADYVATSGTLTFAPRERVKKVDVTVNADALDEPTETFFLSLSNESSGTMIDGQAVGYIGIVDWTPPETTIETGPSGLTSDSTPTFTFSADEASTFECRLDYGSYAACTSSHTTAPLAEGLHTFQVRAIDTGGNIDATPARRRITVDTVAPKTSIDSGPAGPTNDPTPTFTFSSEPGATYRCGVDGSPLAACTSPHTTPPLADGAHAFEVLATDPAGNVEDASATRAFTVDTSAPLTTIESGPAGPTNDSTPTFTFSGEAGAAFWCRVDSARFAPCASPHTTASLADGAHRFDVLATDAVGNVGPSTSRGFTVDTVAPETTIDSGPLGPIIDTTPTFAFSANEAGAGFECRIDDGAFASCASPHTAAALTRTGHTFAVRALDAAGNADPTPASRAFAIGAARTSVSVLSRVVPMTSKGVVAIKLRCGAAACRGTLTLSATVRRRALKLAGTRFSIAAGRTATVKVKLTVRGYKLVLQRKQLKAKLKIEHTQPAGGTTTVVRALTLKAPRGR